MPSLASTSHHGGRRRSHRQPSSEQARSWRRDRSPDATSPTGPSSRPTSRTTTSMSPRHQERGREVSRRLRAHQEAAQSGWSDRVLWALKVPQAARDPKGDPGRRRAGRARPVRTAAGRRAPVQDGQDGPGRRPGRSGRDRTASSPSTRPSRWRASSPWAQVRPRRRRPRARRGTTRSRAATPSTSRVPRPSPWSTRVASGSTTTQLPGCSATGRSRPRTPGRARSTLTPYIVCAKLAT